MEGHIKFSFWTSVGLLEIVASGNSTKVIPLYVINQFCFQEHKEETAQYSLHVVGLDINHLNKTISIADPNGPFNGGSNMEFISMPLSKLRRKTTTCVKELNKEMKAKNL